MKRRGSATIAPPCRPYSRPFPVGRFIGGVTTFFTMAYIVVVNLSILSTPGTGIPFSGALTGHRRHCGHDDVVDGTLCAPAVCGGAGMGLNAFFAFTIIPWDRVPWQTALGVVFWSGVLFPAGVGHAAA